MDTSNRYQTAKNDRAGLAYAKTIVSRAHEVLGRFATNQIEKTIWGSPAGKKRIADRLAKLLPPHKTYVEPFAGSAAVLFAKEPVATEVINDADPEIAQAFRAIKNLSKKDIDRLRGMQWTGNEATYKKLVNSNPTSNVEKLHRFLYLSHFSYGKLRGKSFSPSTAGVVANTVKRLESFLPRLRNVRVYNDDYLKVVRKYDGPNTLFFFDPPYVGHDVDVGEGKFDEERFYNVLKSLKGKFLLTYGVRGKLPQMLKGSGFHINRIRTPRSIRTMRGVGGSTMLTQLVVTNYKPVSKDLSNDESLLENWTGQLELDDQDTSSTEAVEKVQPFGTFGGSHHYAKRLLPFIPNHKVYVEPFAGAAALLHVKDPVDKEILADTDDDVVFLHRFIKSMNEDKVEKLRRFDWTCTESSWKRVRDMTPGNELERFYRLAFIRGKGRDARPDATHPAGSAMGQTTNPEKYLRASDRLKKVTIVKQDYHKTISAYDSPDTFFFLDPPYPGEWFDKKAVIDLEDFIETIRKIKGRFIAVLNDSSDNVAAFKQVGHIFRLKVQEASGTGGAKKASRLFCANYRIRKADSIEDIVTFDEATELAKAQWTRSYINDLPDSAFLYIEPGSKKDDDGKTVPRASRHFPVKDHEGNLDIPHLRNAIARIPQSKIPGLTEDDLIELQDKARRWLDEANTKLSRQRKSHNVVSLFTKSVPFIKGVDPDDERYVLGIVLEPEVVDAQGDIYSAEEIRQAAHNFMQDFGGLGLMHRLRVNGQVKVLESYLAPEELSIGNTKVRKGTWLLAVRILSDDLWQKVKDGTLSGFSIGGSARRDPDATREAA